MRGALTLLIVLAVAAPAAADPGDVIVRYTADADAADRADARRDADVRREGALPVSNTELVDPVAGVSVAEAVEALEDDPDVLYAEPDVRRVALDRVPSDRYFGSQWAMRNTGQEIAGRFGTTGADIGATEAWSITTGDPSVVVAIVDSGVDGTHPDLVPNLFVNRGEVAGNGIDDDRNGYVDDVGGWDFVNGDATPDDGDGHGTHVAGTVAARGDDGVGVTGVAWQASLLALKVLDSQGGGTVSDAIRAYRYAARAGARVVNLSLGGDIPSLAELDAIRANPDVLFVAAAGNDGASNDLVGSYPCEYELPNVICVAASDRDDNLATFSNSGRLTVDLAAPGVDIASTYPGGGWALLDGTSMATPHVSGAAALVLSRRPGAAAPELRAALIDGAEPRPGLEGRVISGARLDLPGALAQVGATSSGSASPAATPSASPSGPVAAPPDRSAPLVTVRPASTRRLRTILRSGLRARVSCNEACDLSMTVSGAGRTLARKSAGRRGAGASNYTFRLPSRLGRSRSVLLTLTVRAEDVAGNARRERVRLRVRR